jgi:SAM-dependent methyltransferase
MFTVKTTSNRCKEGRLVDPYSDPRFTKAWFQDGVRLEYSRNREFNKKLYTLCENPQVIDLGCGGGQFILDCVNDGLVAVGLDGYEIYKKYELAAWPIIPNNLFEVDVCEDFAIEYDGYAYYADIITSWEFMEHLYEEDLDGVLDNIKTHLKPSGYYICGISTRDEYGHFLLRNYEWWVSKFESVGLYQQPKLVEFFGNDWVRNLSDSMYFVLKNSKE